MIQPTIFHREPPPWFPQVQDLRPGGKRRINDGQLASFNGKAYHLYDFREKQSEVYEPTLTLAERLAVVAAQREAELEATATAALPTQGAMFHTKDWPADARVWFYKAGINNDDIESMGAFWHPSMRRVVVPYRTLSHEDAWIARDPFPVTGARPKYLFPAGVSRGGGAAFKGEEQPFPSGIVVVEDVLSAFRIAKDTDLLAVAAQGTSLDRHAITQIAANAILGHVPVFTWLDPDLYGQVGARRIASSLGNMGVTVRNIESARDPKLHEPHEIREALET